MKTDVLFIAVWLLSGHLILLLDDYFGQWFKLDTAMRGHYSQKDILRDGSNKLRGKLSIAIEQGIISIVGPAAIIAFLALIYCAIGVCMILSYKSRPQSTLATC